MHPKEQFDRLMEALEEIRDLLAEMNKYRFAEQYLDNDEFTKLLKITKKTAQHWRGSGLIPFAQLGKKIYYRLSDLEAIFDKEFGNPKRLKKKAPAKRKRLRKKGQSNGWVIHV